MMRRRYEYMGTFALLERSLWYRVYYTSARGGVIPDPTSGWLVCIGDIFTPGRESLSDEKDAAYREMTWCASAPVWADALEFV